MSTQAVQPVQPVRPVIAVKPVKSSSVEAFGYDKASNTLRVTFKGGKQYDYEAVSPDLAERLENAESFGKFLAAHILRKHNVVKLEAAK